MRITILRSNLNKTIDPNKDFNLDRPIVPWKKPTSDLELLTEEQLDIVLDEFYKNGTFVGQITDVNKLNVEGEDLVHTNDGLFLKEINETNINSFYFDVDSFGRIKKSYPVSSDYLDSSVKLDWEKVSSKPTTVEGYNVTNLMTINKDYTLTEQVDVILQDKSTRSPVPYSYLQTMWDESNYEVKIGTIIFRPPGSDSSNKKLMRTDGRLIQAKDYPDAVLLYGGKGATEANVPDTRDIEKETLANFGFSMVGYCKVKK